MTAPQAGTMLHPGAQPAGRAPDSTTPDVAAGCRGLLRSLASGLALSPSTTWVPPSNRLGNHIDEPQPIGEKFLDDVNSRSVKSGQDHLPR
jgi:hypothetical protein